MPQEGLQTYSLTKFTGVRNWEADDRIPNNYVYYALNSTFTGGIWYSCQGTEAYLDNLVGGTTIRSLLYYPYQVGSVNHNYILEYYNDQWYLVDTDVDTRSPILDTWIVDEDAGGVIYNNIAYVVSPLNGMAWIDGNVWNTSFTGIPPAGTMMETNAEKLWVAGVNNFPAVIFYSRTASAANPEYARDWTTGSGSALVGHGGYITAIKNLKNTLYVFKNNSIYFLNGFDTSGAYPIPLFEIYAVTSGAINNKCASLVENDIWFLNPQLEIRSLGSVAGFINDTRTNDVSIAIKRYLKQLDPDQSNAAMSYFDKVLKISLRTLGSPTNNFEITYDFNDFGYSIRQLNSIKQYVNTGTRTFFSEDGTSGQLFQYDIGFTMNGEPFQWKGNTLMIDLARPDLFKRLRYVSIHVRRTATQAAILDVYPDDFSATPNQFPIPAPDESETGIVPDQNDGIWDDSMWGSTEWAGNSSINANSNTFYRRVFKYDIGYNDLVAKQFGVGFEAQIFGGFIGIEEIVLQYIVMPEKYRPVDY